MKAARQLSIALLLLLGATALVLSIFMISDPTGNSLGFPVFLLNGSIFNDYATPGWILLFAVGVFSLVVIYLIYIKSRIYSVVVMLQGVIVCVFVLLAVILLEESYLVEYLFIGIGVLLIAVGALQYQRKIVSETKKPQYHPEPKSHHHKHRKHK